MSNNIGYFGVEGTSVPSTSNTEKHTQVYQATHTGNGNRMTMYNRSFISFNYGGKWIEDFNLIATSSNNGIQRTLTTPFEDLMTDHEVADGYFYWGTRYTKKQIDFNLATDGITQPQLEEFRNWFKPGMTRELILAEHPNRAIDARVAAAPVMNVVPFEEKVWIRRTDSSLSSEGEGRNLLLDTINEKQSAKAANGSAYTDYWYFSNYGMKAIKAGETCYVSFDWSLSEEATSYNGTSSPVIYAQLNGTIVANAQLSGRSLVLGENTSGSASFEFVPTTAQKNYADSFRLRVRLNNVQNNLQVIISNIKLEKKGSGTEPTEWSPAPEDEKVQISTTLYKGTMSLSFIAAEPFWHSKVNILSLDGLRNTNAGLGVVTNYDGRTLADYSEADAKELYKIVYEDGVPTKDIQDTLPSGYECTFGSNGIDDYFTDNTSNMRLYYCGTAPCKPIVEFTITPEISDGGAIIFPYNVLYQQEDSQTHKKYPTYNTIAVGDKKLRFSTPSLYTGYNQAIHICDQLNDNVTKEEIRLLFINGINEYYSRAYAIHCLDAIDAVNFTESNITALKSSITGFLKDGNNTLTAKFTIDSERGTAIGLIDCNVFTSDGIVTLNVKENVGDMLRSNYLIIDEKNYPIFSSTETPKITTENTLPVTTDFDFSKLKFIYNYMYQ